MSDSDADYASDIQHDAELGDASEVYRQKIRPCTSFTVDTPHLTSKDKAGAEGAMFIDEIWSGNIALCMSSIDDDAEFTSLAQLGPDDARKLADALNRAADYADWQLTGEQP